MRLSEERYISLLTDFGFKRIFGTKPNKDLLINFLNSLLMESKSLRMSATSIASTLVMFSLSAKLSLTCIVKMRKEKSSLLRCRTLFRNISKTVLSSTLHFLSESKHQKDRIGISSQPMFTRQRCSILILRKQSFRPKRNQPRCWPARQKDIQGL